MKELKIDLGVRSYPVYVGELPTLARRLSTIFKGSTPVLITSSKVWRHCLGAFKAALGRKLLRMEIPDGESQKNLQTAERLYQGLARLGVERKTPLLLLGGGVVGDLGGFVAATYLRGVPYLQIPTTLVAQIDSSIGGKVAVDLPEGKNLVGSFYQPVAVLTDLNFLKTLPRRELRAGLAEAVKYGLIRDPQLFKFIGRRNREILAADLDPLEEVVVRSIRIKAAIVSQDEREETGLRRILNFGHTFGHAIERMTRYRQFRHGEAVAIGMVMATQLSARLGFCHDELAHLVQHQLETLGLPVNPPAFSRSDWKAAIGVDKKRQGGMIQFVFIKTIGNVIVQPIEVGELVKAIA